jgi:uncharacterized protein YbjT (DUF2867 family)
MILVVGATGFLGGEICRRLVGTGRPVRALVRATSERATVDALRNAGVEIVEGDLQDRTSLDAACRGVATVITTATTVRSSQANDSIDRTDRDSQMQLVDAAKAAGVEGFIYTSFSGNLNTDAPLRNAKRSVEQHLQQSGLMYTILRPSYFMEVWLGPALGFDFGNAKATIYGTGQNKISWIALGDVAAFAVEAVDNRAAQNATLELGGPEALSPLEVVRIFEEVGGRPFEVQQVPEEALRAQYEGATDPLQRSFAALTLDYANGDPIDMRATLAAFPVPLTSVRDYARRMLTMPGH